VSPTPQPNYPAWTNSPVPTATPATAISRSNGTSSLDKNRQSASAWFAANRKAALIGALILGTLAALAFFLYRRPRKTSRAKIVKPALSQPKYSTDSELDVLSAEPTVKEEPSSIDGQDVFTSETEEVPDWRRAPIEPAFASARLAPTNGSVSTAPNPAFVANGEASSEEREVFEL
jgi:cytoskeletal protein RodZ